MVAIATTMQDLHDDFAIVFVYGAGDALMVDNVHFSIHGTASREQPAFTIGRDTTRDHHRRAAFGTLCKISSKLAIIIEAIFKAGMHRTHD